MLEPKIAFLVFSTGKIVITGAKSEDDIINAYHKLYPVLSSSKAS